MNLFERVAVFTRAPEAGSLSATGRMGEGMPQHFPEAASLRSGRRDVNVMLAAHPEQQCGQSHEDSRDTECPAVSIVFGDARNDQEREERSEVNTPVE